MSVKFGAVFKIPMDKELVSKFKTQECVCRDYAGLDYSGFVDGSDLVVLTNSQVPPNAYATNYDRVMSILAQLTGLEKLKNKIPPRCPIMGNRKEFEAQEKAFKAEIEKDQKTIQPVMDTARSYVDGYFARLPKTSNLDPANPKPRLFQKESRPTIGFKQDSASQTQQASEEPLKAAFSPIGFKQQKVKQD